MQTSVLSFIRRHSSVPGALAFVLVASASSGCSTEPCPDGTKQDGDVCRRIPAMMRAANQGAGSGAMKDDEENLGDEDLDNPKAGKGGAAGRMSTASAGKGGSAGEDETDGDGDEEEAAGKGGSGGKAGAGGSAGSKAGAGGAGGMKVVTGGMGAAGKAGASSATAGKGAGGAGAGGKDAAAGGGAGKQAMAGAGAAGKGEAGKGEAGKGEAGKGEAGSKATEIPASLLTDTWFCVSLEGGCVCVDGKGESTDTCSSPRPKCCYVLTNEEAPNCQCHAEDSEQCEREGGSEEAIKVDSCPPSAK